MEARRKSLLPPEQRKRVPSLPPLARYQMGSESDMMQPPSADLMIDPNLLVGPVYEGSDRRREAIKEQLGDITARLHQTLDHFDTFDEDEKMQQENKIFNVRGRIAGMENIEARREMESFVDDYRYMSSDLDEAHKDRNELLMSLADWFTTDHLDTSDLTMSMDRIEEGDMNDNYINTLANFEKLKTLQNQITQAGSNGEQTRFLEEERRKIEREVARKFSVVKDVTMQTKAKQSAEIETAPWKHAAGEIVNLLRGVRSEKAGELDSLGILVKGLTDELERQSGLIKSLQGEVKNRKDVATKIADENGDLLSETSQMRVKITRYEKDLDAAQKLIQKQFAKEIAEREGRDISDMQVFPDIKSDEGSGSLEITLSFILSQADGKGSDVKRLSSDPVLLRTQVREYRESVEAVSKELVKEKEHVEDLETEITEKVKEIAELEDDSVRMTHQVTALMRDKDELMEQIQDINIQERAGSQSGVQVAEHHTCSKCHCHIKKSEVVIKKVSSMHLSVPTNKSEDNSSLEKWVKKCTQYKKSLGETELKLSKAFAEISELRLKQQTISLDSLPSTTPVFEKKDVQSPSISSVSSLSRDENIEENAEMKNENDKKPRRMSKTRRQIKVGSASRTKVGSSSTSRRKKEKSAKYDKKKAKRDSIDAISRFPPIEEITQRAMEKKSELPDKCKREKTLWFVGDLQGKMNLLVNNIMEFVTEIGKMFVKDLESEQSGKHEQPLVKTFEFGQNVHGGKGKGQMHAKDLEAKQKRSQVVISGQRAVALLREAYDMLSNSLNLQHDEFELIYRSFKASQQKHAVQQAMIGQNHAEKTRQDRYYGRRSSSGYEYYVQSSNLLKGKMQNHQQGGGLKEITEVFAHESRSIVSVLSSDESQYGGMGNSWKFNETIRIHGLQKSQSDLGLHSGGSADSLQLLQERTERYLSELPYGEQIQDDIHFVPREEVRMSLATVPKKGLIKLQSVDYDMKVPGFFEKPKNEQVKSRQRSSQSSQPTLIKRKDILDKIREGQRLLAEEESKMIEEEEVEKELGEYTVADLQKNINQLTNINLLRRNNETPSGLVSNEIHAQRKPEHQSKLSSISRPLKGRISVPPSQAKDTKKLGTTLPAINMINPF